MTLVKGNQLPLLSETCSTGSKLFETKFLLRLSYYSWSYLHF